MDYYVGLDVSLRSVAVCVIDADGKLSLSAPLHARLKISSNAWRTCRASSLRIGFEAGAMSQHLFYGLRAAGFDVVCMEARQVNAALSAMRNKTDKTDARGIAQVLRSGWFKPVYIKSREAHACARCSAAAKRSRRSVLIWPTRSVVCSEIFGLRLPSRVDQGSFDERVQPLGRSGP